MLKWTTILTNLNILTDCFEKLYKTSLKHFVVTLSMAVSELMPNRNSVQQFIQKNFWWFSIGSSKFVFENKSGIVYLINTGWFCLMWFIWQFLLTIPELSRSAQNNAFVCFFFLVFTKILRKQKKKHKKFKHNESGSN